MVESQNITSKSRNSRNKNRSKQSAANYQSAPSANDMETVKSDAIITKLEGSMKLSIKNEITTSNIDGGDKLKIKANNNGKGYTDLLILKHLLTPATAVGILEHTEVPVIYDLQTKNLPSEHCIMAKYKNIEFYGFGETIEKAHENAAEKVLLQIAKASVANNETRGNRCKKHGNSDQESTSSESARIPWCLVSCYTFRKLCQNFTDADKEFHDVCEAFLNMKMPVIKNPAKKNLQHPVMVVNEKFPYIQFTEVLDEDNKFIYTAVIEKVRYEGKASTAKEAKKQCCIRILDAFNIFYELYKKDEVLKQDEDIS